MTRETVDFGIDLGTTNSAIALSTGVDVHIVKNNEQAEFTPSAVWINKSGKAYVGRQARERIEFDPDNAAGEFKLQMGLQGQEKVFNATGLRMGPEDLSAEVLKSLRTDAELYTGEDVSAAVITVPAAFELHQCEATQRAAVLAGLDFAPLLQEPTAAALAYGFQSSADNVFWLVYDFGGGTFDAAIVHLRDKEFSVVNHRGNNALGGKNIDWAIVDQLLVPAVVRDLRLPEFGRKDPRWRANIAKLKLAAEAAKIRLSRVTSEDIWIELFDEKRNAIEFKYELHRHEVEKLAERYYSRALNLCKQALTEARLDAGDIEKVLLVGGTTLAPYIRERLADAGEGLGIPVDQTLDPVTVVARGAAIFARTQRRPPESRRIPQAGEFVIDLEYDPVGADREPLVGGRVRSGEEQAWSGFTIQISNPDAHPEWGSGKIALADDGTFVTRLVAQEGVTTFVIELHDAKGRRQAVTPDRLTYTTGVTPPPAVLTHSVGVALANGEVEWFLSKGTHLPARKRVVLRTTVDLRRGVADRLVRIPVVEGERARAHRNKEIGTLTVQPAAIPRDLPAGSEVEVTILIDASRLVTTRAYVPILDEEYEQVIKLGDVVPPDARSLRRRADAEACRLAEVHDRAAATDAPPAREPLAKIEAEGIVEEIDELVEAAQIDPDAAATADRRLLDLAAAIDDVEDALRWPELVEEATGLAHAVDELVRSSGDDRDRRDLRLYEDEVAHATRTGDMTLLTRQIENLRSIGVTILDRTGQLVFMVFEELAGKRARMIDLHQADQLIAEGERAITRGDVETLRSVNDRMRRLLPPDEPPPSVLGSTVQR